MTGKQAAALLLGVALVAPGASARGDMASDVIDELNRARADPQGYARELLDYRDRIDGLIAYPEETPDGVMTREGVRAVDEAIEFLERAQPLSPLEASRVLAAGAGDLVEDEGPSGRIGHYTAGGLNPGARVKRHGGDIYVGEVISYGPRDPRAVVRQLIVDDGVPQRGHRLLIFSNQYHYAGAACGTHVRYRSICVVDLAATATGAPRLPASSPAGN